ncbi:transposable element Tcb1 transposase [Trichonephila clavipes]|nr:transposable element Tcb1 transposase [Trichonephila clavipes]
MNPGFAYRIKVFAYVFGGIMVNAHWQRGFLIVILTRHLVWGAIGYTSRSPQQGNVRAHVAGFVRTFHDTENVQLLPWPARSSDISQIENFWSMIVGRLARHQTPVTTVDELCHRVEDAWAFVPLYTIQSLFDSMPRCISAVITVAPELQRRMRTGIYIYLAVTAKRNRRITESDLSCQLSSATGTTVSRQTVYRRLGHIGLYARRPVRCVPLTATH